MLNDVTVSVGFMDKLTQLLRAEADAARPVAAGGEPQPVYHEPSAIIPSFARPVPSMASVSLQDRLRRPKSLLPRLSKPTAGIGPSAPSISPGLLAAPEPLLGGLAVQSDSAVRNPFSPAVRAHLKNVLAQVLAPAAPPPPDFTEVPREPPSLVPAIYKVVHYVSNGAGANEVVVQNDAGIWTAPDLNWLVGGNGVSLVRQHCGQTFVDWQAMSAEQFCRLPEGTRFDLVQAMRSSKARVSYNTGDNLSRNFTHDMTLDAYFGLKNAADTENDALALLLQTGSSVAKQLTAHAWGVFNTYRVATALANLISRANVPGMSVIERQRGRDEMAVVGSSLIAAYINNFRSRQKHQEDGKEVKDAIDAVNQHYDGMPSDVAKLLGRALLQAEGLSQSSKTLYDAVFQSLPAEIGSQAHTDFMACLVAGAQRYAKFAKKKSEQKIEHTSTAMAFVFALAGFIPYAGPFMGLAGLIADKTLHASWKPKDATDLMDYVEASIGSVLRAHVRQESGSTERALSFATDWQDALGVSKPVVWGDADFPLWRRLSMISKKGG